MKVKEIITKKVMSIKPQDNAKSSLDLLLKMQISGLPVIDDKGKLVGMFTEKEVITKVLPTYMENVGGFVYDDNPKAVKLKVLNFDKMKVSDVMRQEVLSVDEDTALCEVAHLMLAQKARRIPVVNKNKDIVGIVSRGDVVRALFAEYK